MEALLAVPEAAQALNSSNSPIYGSVLGTACSFNDQDPRDRPAATGGRRRPVEARGAPSDGENVPPRHGGQT